MIYYIMAKSESDISNTIINIVLTYPKEVLVYSPSQKMIEFNDGLINDMFFFMLDSITNSDNFEDNSDLIIDIDDFKEMWCLE